LLPQIETESIFFDKTYFLLAKKSDQMKLLFCLRKKRFMEKSWSGKLELAPKKKPLK